MTSDSDAFDPDKTNAELMRYAIAERELQDLVTASEQINKSSFDSTTHDAFKGSLSLAQNFQGQVLSPESFDIQDIFNAMTTKERIHITFQSGFGYMVIGDDSGWRYDESGKSVKVGFDGQMGDKETGRSLLVKVVEQTETIKLIPSSIRMRPEDAAYTQKPDANKFIPWTFVGNYNFSAERGDYYSKKLKHKYQVDVNEKGAVCYLVMSSD